MFTRETSLTCLIGVIALAAGGCETQHVRVPIMPPLIGPPPPSVWWMEPFNALNFDSKGGLWQKRNLIAVDLMTDTDNTKSHAVAYFDDLKVSR